MKMKIFIFVCFVALSLPEKIFTDAEKSNIGIKGESKDSVKVFFDADKGLIAERAKQCVVSAIDSSRRKNAFLTKDSIGAKITEFCKGHDIVLKPIEKNAKREAFELITGRSRRAVDVRNFDICNFRTMMVPGSCHESKRTAICRFTGSGCPDVVLCGKYASRKVTCHGVNARCRLRCCDFACFPC